MIYVLGGAVDGVGHLNECFGSLGRNVNYVVVKNYGVAGKFDVYDNSNARQDLLAVGAREIAIPALDGAVYQSVDRARVSFLVRGRARRELQLYRAPLPQDVAARVLRSAGIGRDRAAIARRRDPRRDKIVSS